jgi:hypothetical protein
VIGLVAVALLSACSVEAGTAPERQWSDAPAFSLHPVELDAAPLKVAADRWRIALEAAGCDVVIDVGPAGHEVRGWTAKAWPFPSHWLGVTSFGEERIDVIGELAEERLEDVLTHEIGHAIGLPHVDDRPSVMNDRGGTMTAEDVELAAVAIGCR